MRVLLAGFTGMFLLTASTGFAQPAAQLSPDEIVRALSCPQGTNLGPNGTCEHPGGSSAAAGGDSSSPSVEICAAPPDVPRLLVRTPDGDCVPAKEGTLGFDLGAGAAKTAPAATNAPAARPGANGVASLAPRNVPAPASTPVSLAAPSLDLLLTFDTDSASLTEQGSANARAFAEALKRPELRQARFEIEGHTDASGSREYNLVLSQKRADAVKAFLVSLGVEADRLTPVGYAFDRLAIADQPTSRANRRVVARRLQ